MANEIGVLTPRTTKRHDALRVYAFVAAIASIPLVIQTIRTDWSLDVWQHAAAVLELSSHPFDPGHPTVASDAGHPDLSPFLLFWGLVHRATELPVFTLLMLAGLVNLAAIWVGLWMLARRLTRAPFAPALAIPAVLLVWGYRPWRWSGYPSLNSIGFGLPYPSFAALAAFLVGLAIFIDWIREPRWARAGLIAMLGAFATLAHPITGVAFGLAVATLLVEDAITRRAQPVAVIQLLVPASLAVVVVLAWPFYSVTSLLDHADSYNDANSLVLEKIPLRAGLALACLPLTALLGWRRRDWRLLALAMPPLTLVGAGVVVESPGLGRLLPFALLPIQLAVADVVAGAFSPAARWRQLRLGFGFGVAAIGLVGVGAAIPHMIPDRLLPATLRDDDRLETATDDEETVDGAGTGMVVIAPEDRLAWPTLATGAKLVGPPYGAPEVDDSEERVDAVESFLDATLARQLEIAEEYDATHVLVSREAAEQVDVEGLGTVVWSSDGVVLIRI